MERQIELNSNPNPTGFGTGNTSHNTTSPVVMLPDSQCAKYLPLEEAVTPRKDVSEKSLQSRKAASALSTQTSDRNGNLESRSERQALTGLTHKLLETFPVPMIHSITDMQRAGGHKSECHFWFSNEFPNCGSGTFDLDFRNTIEQIKAHNFSIGSGIKAAMVVGESSLTSILPEMEGIDVVLLTDYDPILLHSMMYTMHFLKGVSSIKEAGKYLQEMKQLTKAYCKNKRSSIGTEINAFVSAYQLSKQFLGDYHPFSSDDRLKQVKDSLNRTVVVPVCLNLLSKHSISTFSGVLSSWNAQIHFLNMSNALEKCLEFPISRAADVLSSLKLLPLAKDALCADSLLLSYERKRTRCFLSRDSYWEAIDNHKMMSNEEKFLVVNGCSVM
ncbi:hypothetical protein [Parendozoicomonas haliclonae]|uniref:Uncharacterized protein n=1 Tax=Parendozoicomonas haliclonae TaxID=1960125 RepID=A0A1X7AF40_9GAMM|nr:hypothetical protein [Parendozoicomonas haliclonae]SMA34813.1 hypothetical protein EHSB41UT_00452 [Parendozoicomonas haliclonae]